MYEKNWLSFDIIYTSVVNTNVDNLLFCYHDKAVPFDHQILIYYDE